MICENIYVASEREREREKERSVCACKQADFQEDELR